MDNIRILGVVVFALGLIIDIFNTKWKWPFGKYELESKNKNLSKISTLLIIIGFIIVLIRSIYVRQTGSWGI